MIKRKQQIRTLKLLLGIALMFSFSACNEQPDANWVSLGLGYVKPGAPVSLQYQVPDELVVGQPFNVEVIFTSTTRTGTMEINISREGEVELLDGSRFVFNLSEVGKRSVTSITASANGMAYLNINILERDDLGNALLGRSFSIPLLIGAEIDDVNKKPTFSVNESDQQLKLFEDDGELIIEMPAAYTPENPN